jgi:hypothetical protein
MYNCLLDKLEDKEIAKFIDANNSDIQKNDFLTNILPFTLRLKIKANTEFYIPTATLVNKQYMQIRTELYKLNKDSDALIGFNLQRTKLLYRIVSDDRYYIPYRYIVYKIPITSYDTLMIEV